jgi:flagellar biosynthesis/type III secretory pathway protein FliH
MNEEYDRGYKEGHAEGMDVGAQEGYDAGYDDAVWDLKNELDELRDTAELLRVELAAVRLDRDNLLAGVS